MPCAPTRGRKLLGGPPLHQQHLLGRTLPPSGQRFHSRYVSSAEKFITHFLLWSEAQTKRALINPPPKKKKKWQRLPSCTIWVHARSPARPPACLQNPRAISQTKKQSIIFYIIIIFSSFA
jgi:hypothetical protein